VGSFEVQYEWDPAKADANVAKHGITFETAKKAFDDPNLVLLEDRIDEMGEQRWHLIAGAGGVALLLVVHVYREDENAQQIIRIISARKANPGERRIYFRKAHE